MIGGRKFYITIYPAEEREEPIGYTEIHYLK